MAGCGLILNSMEHFFSASTTVYLRALFILNVAVLTVSIASAQDKSGETIYKQDCLKCHGAAGEGTKKAPQPLVGEKSPAQLATVIVRTMPDDDPGTCTAVDAKKVAAYLHDAFYSPDARAKLNPPRVELSRLTVQQYRNSVADIIGGFGKVTKIDQRHGLHGEYFYGRGFGGRKPLLDRIDSEVKFDFGVDAPDGSHIVTAPVPEVPKAPASPVTPPKAEAEAPAAVQPVAADASAPKNAGAAPAPKAVAVVKTPEPEPKVFSPKQFSISWDGSISPPETGSYEFIVRSEHAIQLWVNDLNRKNALIDAVVRSGADSEVLSGTIFLLAGRSYSIRLEFSKGRELDKKGLDDPKKESKKASIALWWKAPHGELEIIPASVLSPARSPETLVVGTPFPPDDRSYGWERGTTVSKEWHAATTDAALEVAGYIVARLPGLSGVAADAPDAKTKLRVFARTFAERAFRRPLTDAEKLQFVDKPFDATSDLELALKRVMLLVLKSPRFLYPGVMDNNDYAVASRLSFALWDSPPDQTLLDAAAAKKLSTRDEIAAQAERMLNAPRAHAKLREFLLTWLRVDRFQEFTKDAKSFPGFDSAVAADLRKSMELFLDNIVWSDTSDFRQLLLSNEVFLNARLAKFYGVALPAGGASDTEFSKVKWDADHRAGVLTHPYMLAGLAYPKESSPIHRGVFVVRGLLGMTLLPPPEAVAPLAPDLHPNLTTRDRVTLQTKADACIRCHGVINPLGFTLENFDAAGRFRELENEKPIDVSGQYETRTGEIAKFSGAKQLAALLAADEQVHAAFVQQLFQHIVKQPVRAYGLTLPQKLQQSFSKSNYSVRKLAVEIACVVAQPAKSQQP